jgi:hypothetical protein
MAVSTMDGSAQVSEFCLWNWGNLNIYSAVISTARTGVMYSSIRNAKLVSQNAKSSPDTAAEHRHSDIVTSALAELHYTQHKIWILSGSFLSKDCSQQEGFKVLKGEKWERNLHASLNVPIFVLRIIQIRAVAPTKHILLWSLTLRRLTTYIYVIPHRKPPDVAFYIFSQQIYVLNILNMLHILHSFLFKMPFVS